MKKTAIGIVLVFFAALGTAAAQTIQKGETLDLNRCISIALDTQPSIISAENTALSSQEKVRQYRSGFYPQVSASTSASRNSSSASGVSALGGGSTAYNSYSAGATLRQNIFAFGKTSNQVEIGRLQYDSSLSDLENVTNQVTLNVKESYFGVLQAKHNREVNAESVRQYELQLKQAQGFYEVGEQPKYYVTTAQVNLSTARLNLLKSENALRLAFVSLSNAMGITSAPEYDIEDILAYQKYDITLDEAVSRAYVQRPDLKAAMDSTRAAQVSIDFQTKNLYPALSGNASYSWSGTDFPLASGWSLGATVSVPVFTGFSNRSLVEQAKAGYNVTKANEDTLRLSISLDVQQAYLNLRNAEESIPAAELTVTQAQENLELATGRYAAGVGNPIEVTNAEASLVSAKTSYIQALYDFQIAKATLENAMGQQ